MSITIAATLIAYKLLLLAIGFWAQQRTQNNEDFFLGGRQLGPMVAALSYSASSSSAWTLLGMSGLAYTVGVYAFWLAGGAIFGAVFAWAWVAPRLMRHSRAKRQLTLTDFLAEGASQKQHLRIRVLATGIILISFIFYIAAQFQGAGTTFAATFGTSTQQSILLGAAIIVVYTLLGGFWAASLTDSVQGVMMLVASLVLPLAAFIAAGGWGGIVSTLHAADMTRLLSLSAGNAGWAGAGFVIGGLSVGISAFGQPHLASRFMALRDQKALNQARVLAVVWFTLVFLGMCVLGLSARVIIPATADPEGLFFAMTQNLLPPIAAGVMTAAVLSAIMSTADSMLLVGAAAIAHDLKVARRFPGRELLISRVAMITLAVAAVVTAIFMPASIFNRALFAWVAIGSAFGPVLIVRLAGIRVAGGAVFAAMSVSFVLAVTLYLLPNTPGDIAERILPFFTGTAILLLWRERH